MKCKGMQATNEGNHRGDSTKQNDLLRRALDSVVNEKMFADFQAHGNTKWKAKPLVALVKGRGQVQVFGRGLLEKQHPLAENWTRPRLFQQAARPRAMNGGRIDSALGVALPYRCPKPKFFVRSSLAISEVSSEFTKSPAINRPTQNRSQPVLASLNTSL